MQNRLKLQPHSVLPVKLPTIFAEFNSDLSIYEKPFIDCSGCENIDAPASVKEMITKAITVHPELIWDHWNPQDTNIRRKIAKLHRVDVDQVFITSGAIAGIDYCFKIFSKPGTKSAIRKPDWPGFDHYADFYQTEKHYLKNFKYPFYIDADNIMQFIKKNKIEFMIIANPVPVQGHLIAREDIERMLQECPETLFVIDEADIVTPPKQAAILATKYNNAIFLGSFSKLYGLSGLRLGYLVTPKKYVEHFKNTINVVEVSSLAILAGNLVLDDKKYQKKTQANVANSIKILQEACQGTNYQVTASPHCFAAYIYSEKSNPKKDLERHGIKILEGQYFGLPAHINGGRFNLSNPINAELVAKKIKAIHRLSAE